MLVTLLLAAVTARAEPVAPTYEKARLQFRQLCAAAANEVHLGRCLTVKVANAADEDLTIDTALFQRAGNESLLLVTSGVHGPELPAGSAIEQIALREYIPQLLNRGVDVVLIHALNPYGCKHLERGDEHNVNLNRAFSSEEQLFQTPNDAYADRRSLFEPQGPVSSYTWAKWQVKLQFLWQYLRDGLHKSRLSQGMNGGQYRFPQGLNYGGQQPNWITMWLKTQLKPLFQSHSGTTWFLDIHTGLGDAGILHLIEGQHPPQPLLAELNQRIHSEVTAGAIQFVAPDSGANENFYTTTGDSIDFVTQLHPHPDNILALTMEFGTEGTDLAAQLEAVATLVLHNQTRQFGCDLAQDCARLQRSWLDLFQPQNQQWQERVIHSGRAVLNAIGGLGDH